MTFHQMTMRALHMVQNPRPRFFPHKPEFQSRIFYSNVCEECGTELDAGETQCDDCAEKDREVNTCDFEDEGAMGSEAEDERFWYDRN